MSIVLSIPFNSLSIPFVSLLKIFHFSLLYPIHTIVNDSGAGAGDDLTERLEAEGYHVECEPRSTGDGFYESTIKGVEDNLIEITI